jgi:hypothetical protein
MKRLREEEDLAEHSTFLKMILSLRPKMHPERHSKYPKHEFFYDFLALHCELKKMKITNPEI